jgi:hypothetical protein
MHKCVICLCADLFCFLIFIVHFWFISTFKYLKLYNFYQICIEFFEILYLL